MAEQLNHTNSEVVYFDFSKSSMSIVQLKAKWRGNLKIIWINDWIESISRLGIGLFDLAVSTGVLHHLKSPEKGLRIMNDVQTKYGGAEFMVYGKYGRTPVYQIQELLRIVNKNEKYLADEIENAKSVLDALPTRNLFNSIEITDHIHMGDAGIYDLLLHHRDIAYSIPEFYRWIEQNGYMVVDFVQPNDAIQILLTRQIQEKQAFEREIWSRSCKNKALIELISGNLILQDFYVSKLENSEASPSHADISIYAYGSPLGFRQVLNDRNNYRVIQNETFVLSKLGRSQVNELLEDTTLYRPQDATYLGDFAVPFSDFNRFVIEKLTRKPIRETSISSIVIDYNKQTKSSLSMKKGTKLISQLFWYLKQSKMFFLKHKSIPTFPLTCCSYNMYSLFAFNVSVKSNSVKRKTIKP